MQNIQFFTYIHSYETEQMCILYLKIVLTETRQNINYIYINKGESNVQKCEKNFSNKRQKTIC